jgi:hypothetical protein
VNTFTSKCGEATDANAARLDTRKHVNYVQGMVLGADDLHQDFAYHQNQYQWLARDAIGYGTLSGLQVESVLRDASHGPEISVSPGSAITARGQLLRVVPRQCAAVNAWLALDQTKTDLKNLGVPLAGAGAFTAYVVLCFRDCKVDPLPIPGEPCRCADQAMAPSRVLDDFRLELRLAPPAQREEDAIRDFVNWLRQIKVSATASSYTSLDDFLQAIRYAAENLSSPPESPPYFAYGSPPHDLVIPAGQLCEYLRAATRLWVTELRPLWKVQWTERVGGGCGCHGAEQDQGGEAEECLLLASLNLKISGGQVTTAGDIAVDDSRRPLVVHLRMLQELLLCGPCCGADCQPRTFANIFALNDHTLRLWIHYPDAVMLDTDALDLQVDDQPANVLSVKQWNGGGSSSAALNVFDLDLGDSPPNPLAHQQRIALRLDLKLVTSGLSPALSLSAQMTPDADCYLDVGDGVAQVFGVVESAQTVQLPSLGGDVTGPIQHNTVTGINNFPVDISTAASTGADPVLAFNGSKWHLANPTVVPPIPQASTRTPQPVTPGVGTPGTDPVTINEFARADHSHPYTDPVPQHNQNPNAHPNLALGGDVVGTPSTTAIARLQGQTVNASNPGKDDLLQFDGSAWSSSSAKLAGDTVGQFGQNVVQGLRGFGIATPDPNNDGGKVVTFQAAQGGNPAQWTLQPPPVVAPGGPFVEHPKDQPRYSIVAAGIVSPSTSQPSQPPVYNELAASGTGIAGELRITFKSYSKPQGDFQYIVKALLVVAGATVLRELKLNSPLISFNSFLVKTPTDPGGILLNITDLPSPGGAPVPVPVGTIERLSFMIEVSQFGKFV